MLGFWVQTREWGGEGLGSRERQEKDLSDMNR